MKRTNLLRKSINLALSILVAGSIVAVGTDGTTLASIFGNNDAIITSVVDAAEVAQIPWSTAYVYGLLPIDLSTKEGVEFVSRGGAYYQCILQPVTFHNRKKGYILSAVDITK